MCQSNNGKPFTSGGGFSTYFAMPAYQISAVADYFVSAANAGQSPVAGYGTGRGYPDISLAGVRYLTIIAGREITLSGTSASAPALGGFFSNINAARIAAGKGSLGWVNPVLYANSTSFVKDITSGNIKCNAYKVCCSQGFYAAPGWDPASGLGSLNFGKFQSVLMSLGNANGAFRRPTPTPT